MPTVNSKSVRKLLIVDDHLLFADGLEMILSQLDYELEITVSSDAVEVLNTIQNLKSYDLLLVDLQMPEIDGFNFLRAIREQKLDLKVVVISGTDDKRKIQRAIGMGAVGFIPKDSPTKEMLLGVETVLSGGRYLPAELAESIDWISNHNDRDLQDNIGIGPKQQQVLRLMQEGLQNKQMAAIMGVSVSAIKRHVEFLFKSLNVKNRTACVQAAVERGLL